MGSRSRRRAVARAPNTWRYGRHPDLTERCRALRKPLCAESPISRWSSFEPFDRSWVPEFPVLRDVVANPIVQGMSVCRLGYPFHTIQPVWGADRGEFALPQGAFPVPSFALDGVVARFHRSVAEGGHEATFIATSTPGLRGQSGGPLLDAEGRLCGIQSHTAHLDLGFDGHFSAGEQLMAERQFLNVGAATHVSDVRSVLDEAGVSYNLG